MWHLSRQVSPVDVCAFFFFSSAQTLDSLHKKMFCKKSRRMRHLPIHWFTEWLREWHCRHNGCWLVGSLKCSSVRCWREGTVIHREWIFRGLYIRIYFFEMRSVVAKSPQVRQNKFISHGSQMMVLKAKIALFEMAMTFEHLVNSCCGVSSDRVDEKALE